MTHKEVAVWGKQVSKPIEQLALGYLIEVDHDVPTEDDVKGATHGPGVYEVELMERDAFLQGWHDTHQARVRPVPLPEPALQVCWRQPLDPLSAIHPSLGCIQDMRVNIGGQNLHVPRLRVWEDCVAHHGKRIGLFPSRAAR